jgi:hypothetical protein
VIVVAAFAKGLSAAGQLRVMLQPGQRVTNVDLALSEAEPLLVTVVDSASTPVVGVDLNNCVNDKGCLEPWAQQIVVELNSYTEVSPSGTGVKIWVTGTLPIPENKTGCRNSDLGLEMYQHGRYFTIAGNRLPDCPSVVSEATEAIC